MSFLLVVPPFAAEPKWKIKQAYRGSWRYGLAHVDKTPPRRIGVVLKSSRDFSRRRHPFFLSGDERKRLGGFPQPFSRPSPRPLFSPRVVSTLEDCDTWSLRAVPLSVLYRRGRWRRRARRDVVGYYSFVAFFLWSSPLRYVYSGSSSVTVDDRCTRCFFTRHAHAYVCETRHWRLPVVPYCSRSLYRALYSREIYFVRATSHPVEVETHANNFLLLATAAQIKLIWKFQ